MEKAVVHSTKSHSKTYSLLRAFKTPQYDNLYVLRNKKGFNTLGFNLKYDVVVADKDGKVLDTIGAIKVGTVSRHYKTAHLIMFMPVGSLNFYDVKKLDQIRLTRKW